MEPPLVLQISAAVHVLLYGAAVYGGVRQTPCVAAPALSAGLFRGL